MSDFCQRKPGHPRFEDIVDPFSLDEPTFARNWLWLPTAAERMLSVYPDPLLAKGVVIEEVLRGQDRLAAAIRCVGLDDPASPQRIIVLNEHERLMLMHSYRMEVAGVNDRDFGNGRQLIARCGVYVSRLQFDFLCPPPRVVVQAGPRPEAPPISERAKKQTEARDIALDLFPDPNELGAKTTAAITDAVNAKYRRRTGKPGNLITNKPMDEALGRTPEHVQRKRRRKT